MDMTNENRDQVQTRNVYPNKRVQAQMNPEQIAQSIKKIAKGIHRRMHISIERSSCKFFIKVEHLTG